LEKPVIIAGGARELQELRLAPEADPTLPTHRPRCLVLVESRSLRMLVRLILSLEGWDVTEQEDPARPSYQAVVADLDCFVWTCDRVQRVVRQAAITGMPVLALTCQEMTAQDRAALGSPHLLTKPFELTAFLQVLQSWQCRLPAPLPRTA
jgi:CheY-like chemotaxis protein